MQDKKRHRDLLTYNKSVIINGVQGFVPKSGGEVAGSREGKRIVKERSFREVTAVDNNQDIGQKTKCSRYKDDLGNRGKNELKIIENQNKSAGGKSENYMTTWNVKSTSEYSNQFNLSYC